MYQVKPNGTKKLVAQHEYVDDPLEKIQFPIITTEARDFYTGDKVGTNFNQKIVDKVSCRNLLLDRTYRIEGEVREKDSGIIVATGTTLFTPKAEDEVQEVVFTFNSDTEGKDLVVYEDVKIVGNGASVAEHKVMSDEKQTVHYPKVRTKAIEQNTMSHVGTVTDKTTEIKDTVSCTNLIVGKEYTVTGKLKNKNTDKFFQMNGVDVTASKTFIAKEKNEQHVLTFTVRTSDLAGQTLVAFEDLYHNDVRVATHSEINDEEQSIHYPEVATKAIDVNTQDEVGKVGQTQIIDTVHLTNLIPGLSYTLSGVAMDKNAHITLGSDVGNEAHRAVRTFTATAAEMDVQMVYTMDVSKYEEKTLVIFEELIFNGKVVRTHNDYNDLEQTVYFPKVRTVAIEDNTGTHVGTATNEETTITDTVKCTNLVVDKKYHVHGVLMNKDTEKVFTKDGVEVRAAKEFVAESKNQNIELTFTVKTADLAGKSLVAFEELYHNNVKVAFHTDLKDEDQTIRYPELGTQAIDNQTEDEVAVVGQTTIEDTVKLENLVIGQEYTIRGRLMDKDTKDYLGKDKGKPEIKQEYIFTATAHEMTIVMSYPVDAKLFEGKTSVVFENLYVNGKLVREHERFEDEKQTVYFPKIRTTALDQDTETHVGKADGLASYVVDTVHYWNLVPGKEYTLNGVLMNQSTNEPWLEDGEEVTATKTFTPSEPNGSVDLIFELLYPDALAEQTLTAFEDLYHNSVKVTTHSDITDEKQTIHYPEK